MASQKYILKATNHELRTSSGYAELTVVIHYDDSRMVIGDGEEAIILTPSQVRKLRKVIDKHFPIGTSEG